MNSDVSRQYPKMLELAAAMNCSLKPSRDDMTILRGLCPFHQASRMHDSRTLRIDAKTGRFKCDFCSKSGTPLAFAATTWGVNAKDAHILLEHYKNAPLTPDRPPYPPNMRELAGSNERYPWINSAVMSRAAAYYQEMLYSHYPALRTLAKMGVNPERAEKAGVGYCTGSGLREYLLEHTDVTEAETEGSPLWQEGGIETLAGRITIADRDHTGGAIWITSITPERDEHGHDWRRNMPYNLGLRGSKPFLFGMYSVTALSEHACITDDPRLYIVAAAFEVPAVLITQIRRQDEDVTGRAKRIASSIIKRNPKALSICMHDREAAAIIENELGQASTPPAVAVHPREAFMKQLKPDTREIKALKNALPPSGRERRHKGRGAKATAPPETVAPETEDETPLEI